MTPSLLSKIRFLKEQLPKETYREWVSNTPVDTGNARRRTRLNNNTINADYDYAVPLDKGHSKQARRGMNQPTWEWFKRRVSQILGAK